VTAAARSDDAWLEDPRQLHEHRDVRIELLPKQREFMLSLAPELLYSGALGAGKSFVGCSKILAIAQRYPGSTQAIIRKRLVDLRRTTMQTFFREVCPPEHVANWNKSENRVTVKAGRDGSGRSDILFVGLVSDRGETFNVRSLTLGSAFIDEVVQDEENEWDEVGNRLRDLKSGVRQVMGATNPGARGHWLYRRFFAERDPKVQHTVQATTLDNPHLPPDYVERIKRLKGRYYDRFVLGKWIGFEGLVYDVFDPLTHVITWEQFAARFGKVARNEQGTPCIPEAWRRVKGIDFGYANPFVHQWWAVSHDGDWFRYREIYHTRKIVQVHAGDIKRWSADEPYGPTYADHDAEDRATLAHYGIPTRRAKKDISPGIQHVYRLLTPEERAPGQAPLPRMFFIKGALVEEDPALAYGEPKKPTCTEEEMQVYRYPRGSDAKNPKENPVDVDNHGADTTRYCAYSDYRREARTADAVGARRIVHRRPSLPRRGELPR
jgi:PBSX family phage terminase large subunit